MINDSEHTMVRVRIAPSPTGYMHIGLARSALFNYAFAKKLGGSFLLRIEDTDRERSKKEFEDDIKKGLTWLGIVWDEEPLRQSERGEVYKKYLKQLIDGGNAYLSQEEGGGGKRNEVIRFKNPNKVIEFNDILRGNITIDTTDLGDFVIAKDLNTPLYHLAVVIDDFESGITHIIRGDDGIANTPRQILIQEAIGAPRPLYAHIPLIVAPDHTKLSKRHGSHSLRDFRSRGYVKEAIVNFIALLGWHPEKNDKELFSLAEFVEEFSIERVVKSAAIFDKEKLNWMNREYMRSNPHIDELLKQYIPPSISSSALLVSVILERIYTLEETRALFEKNGELSFLAIEPFYEKNLLIEKKKNPTFEIIEKHLHFIINELSTMSETSFSPEAIKEKIWNYATEEGRGQVLWPMRVALTGKEKSPDPFTVAALLGREKTFSYLQKACDIIK